MDKKPKPYCQECHGTHEPSGSRSDCIKHWQQKSTQNYQLLEVAVALLCSATPNPKFLTEEKQQDWAKGFGKFFAEAQEVIWGDKGIRKLLRDCNGTCVCHHLFQWMIDGKYRVIMHRHTGYYAAEDQSSGDRWEAETLPLLADALLCPPQWKHNPEYNSNNFRP